MKQAEIALLGDTHLSRLMTYFPNKDWLQWSLRPFFQVEKYCLDNGIKYVIQTGDLFDDVEPSQEVILALIDFLLASKLEWHFSLGNHDIESRNKHSLILLKYFSLKGKINNCFFYPKTQSVLIDGIRVVFLPYPKTRHKLLNAKPSLIVAHVERKGAKYDNGRRVSDHSFKLGKHYWVIGHLHEYQKGRRHVYPGAPLQLRYGDTQNKFFLHLKIKQTNREIQVKYKKKRIQPPYIFADATINTLEDAERSFKNLEENVYLRLFINAALALPSEYVAHPQVLKTHFFGDKKDVIQIKDESFNLKEVKINSQSRLEALNRWLKTKSKLNKQRRKLAIKMAKRAERELVKAV